MEGTSTKSVGLGHLNAARFLEDNHEIQAEIAQEGERVSCIDSQRGEDGKDLSLEVVIKSPGLFVIEVLNLVQENPGLRKSGQHHIHDAPILFANEGAHLFRDFIQLLRIRPAARIHPPDIRAQDAEEFTFLILSKGTSPPPSCSSSLLSDDCNKLFRGDPGLDRKGHPWGNDVSVRGLMQRFVHPYGE